MAIDVNARLRNAQARIEKRIDEMTNEAIEDLEILSGMYQVRADYEWLLALVKVQLPLFGVGGSYLWIEEQMIRQLANSYELGHMADAIIDELNHISSAPQVIPSRAAIIMRNDEALTF